MSEEKKLLYNKSHIWLGLDIKCATYHLLVSKLLCSLIFLGAELYLKTKLVLVDVNCVKFATAKHLLTARFISPPDHDFH